MKTNKSYGKRIKLTRSGKCLTRKAGKCHFNSKSSGVNQLAGKRMQDFTIKRKLLKHFLQKSQ